MNLRAVVYPILIGALVWGGSPYEAAAQNRTVQGVSVSIGPINLIEGNNIVMNVDVKNTSANRAYLFFVGNKRSSLSNGFTDYINQVVGIPACDTFTDDDARNMNKCLADHGNDLDYYQSLEPGDSVTISLTFKGMTAEQRSAPIAAGTTMNYSLRLAARFGPASPSSIQDMQNAPPMSRPQAITFNFPPIPVKEN